MNSVANKMYLQCFDTLHTASDKTHNLLAGGFRRDRWAALVVIGLALVLAVGLAVAWWITCQNRGMYPAVDMPSFQHGGTWKVYCKR